MTDNAMWLLMPFAVVLVAALARLSGKVDKLEKRLARLEPAAGDESGTRPDNAPVPASSARRPSRPHVV